MFINYYYYRKEMYECKKDGELIDFFKGKTINLNLKVTFLILFNILAFKINSRENYKVQKNYYYTNELICNIRGGCLEDEINQNLTELDQIEKLKIEFINKTPSFNKYVVHIYNKMVDPVLNGLVENPKTLTLLQEFFKKSPVPNTVYNLQPRKVTSKQLVLKESQKTKTKAKNSILYADALVPLNPRMWPAYGLGSRIPDANVNDPFKTKTDVVLESIRTPGQNLQTSAEFLYRSKSDLEYRSRLLRLISDTITVNILAVNDFGAVISGTYATRTANAYMMEMLDREVSLNEREKLNMEIYKQVAKSKNIEPDLVEGIGLIRNFAPEYDKGSLFEKPGKSRPTWEEETYNNKLSDKDFYQ